MTVINGFIIFVMLLLMAYMGYRLFMKRRIINLLSLFAQLFALLLAALCFFNNMAALLYIEAVFVLLGILFPCCFIVSDYLLMLKGIKEKGIYEGFIKPVQQEPDALNRLAGDASKLNPIINELPVGDIIKEIAINNEEIFANIKHNLHNAQSLLNKKDFNGAYDTYGTLVKIITNCSGLLYNQGNVCCHLGYYSDAVQHYSRALEIGNKKQYAIYYNLGNAQFMLKKYENAIQSYNKALELKPDLMEANENIALAMLGMGETQKAFDHYRQITKYDGHNLKAHYILCRLLAEAGNYAEAEAEAEKCIRLDPGSYDTMAELGKLRAKQGKLKEALEAYDGLIRLQPDNYNGYYNKGSLFYKIGKKREAIECFRKVIELKPDNYKSYYNMAVALDELGNKDAAFDAFKTAIGIKPDFVDAYNNLGILLSTMNRPDEAIAVYEAGISKNPEDYSLFLNKGITLYEAGRYKESVTAFKTALELKPEEKEINYYLGSALTEARMYNEALESYKRTLKIKPEDSEVFYSLATVYSLLGKYDIAADNLKKAVELKEDFRSDARTNRAFDGMRGKSFFRELVS